MRASRVFRMLFRIFIALLTLSVTIVSLLGGISAVTIFMNQENIGIDDANREFNMSFNFTSGVLLDANFTQPFNITNAGFFDIENFQLRVDLAMNYSHVNYTRGVEDPTPGVNGTKTVKIFEKSQYFGNVLKGSTGYFNFTGLSSDFFTGVYPNITEIDIFKPSPLFEFYTNFTISLDYSLGMHSVVINLRNWLVYEIDSIIP